MSDDLVFLDTPPQPEAPEPVETPTEAPEPTEAQETPVEAKTEEHDPDEVPLTDEEHAERSRKKTGSQRAREAAQRERERAIRLEAENEALRRQLNGGKEESKAAVTPVDKPKPKAEDFDTHEDYLDALSDWKVDVKLAERERNAQAEKLAQSWEEKKSAARQKYDDFDEVFNEAPMPGPIVAGALLKHAAGVEIGYYLAKNPDTYKRLNAMKDPIDVAYEMASIASKIATPEKTKATSNAPRPPAPVRAAAPVPAKDNSARYEVGY